MKKKDFFFQPSNYRLQTTEGFTFIELMLVIVILGILAALISGNFITSLKKGRDARRKGDLEQTQRALELYYEDNRAYPSTITFDDSLCQSSPCGSSKIYMQKLPVDPSGYDYEYESDGTYYRMYSCLENNLDQGSGVDQNGYGGTTCGACSGCKYKVTSSNVQ